jgi:two-component system cell cycle response regulator
MTDKTQQTNSDHFDMQKLVRSLNGILTPGREVNEVLEAIVQEVSTIVNCDHLFLSRYEASHQIYRAVAWRSSINPGNVSLDQKFMGTSYLGNQPIVVNDMSQYNYRLRPAVARLGLLSMVGVPIISEQGVIGVLEAFSQNANHFSDIDVECLFLFAKQAAVIMEKADLVQDLKLRETENDFLVDALKVEQASIGSLLYKVGETFDSLFSVDGIAVFGIDPEVKGNPLQEVMAKGFAMSDLGKLKTLFNREYMDRLIALPQGEEPIIIKHSMRKPGPGGAKLIYTVPILYKHTLHGIVVFYWKGSEKELELVNLERFIKRIIEDLTVIFSRKHLYSNIKRMSFSDILTGLANRRLFDYVLDREFKKAKRMVKPLSLLMVDIDFFKKVNDTFGHLVGDTVLENIGAILKEGCRDVDLPARYGGEEFSIVLPETDQTQALAIAERVRERIEEHQFQIGNQFISITASIGGATYDGEKNNGGGDSLIQAADQALYQAKQSGRNVVIFSRNY